MSNIKINVEANTNQAKQSFSDLGKHIANVKKEAQGYGIGSNLGGIDNPKLMDFASKDKDNIGDLSEVIRKLSNTIDNLGQKLTDKNIAYNTPTTNYSSNPPSLNTNSNSDSSNTKNFQDGLFGKFTKAGLAIGAGRATFSYIREGAAKAASYEKNALDTYNKIGAYGNDFNKARSDASNLGKKFGYDTGEVMGLQNTLMSGGYFGLNDLQENSKNMMETSLAFGINSNTLGSDFAELRKRSFNNISSKDYTDAIGTNVAASGMKGREDEVARSLADITDTITKGKLEVTSSDFEMAASLQAQLARQNPALKGDKGAELVSKMQGGFNAKDTMTLRMFGYGEELGYGIHGLHEARKRAEQGFSNPEGIASLSRRLSRETHGDTEAQSLWLQDHMGVKTEEADEIVKLLNSGGPEDFKVIQEKYGKGGDKQKQLDSAINSKALTNTNYQLNKDAAKMDAGNIANEVASPAKSLYNKMPTGIQATATLVGAMAVGGLKGAALGSIPKLLAKGFGKGTGEALEGASQGVGVLAKASKFGKVAGGIGIAADAVGHAYEAYGNFKKGDTKEGIGAIGGGIGSIGGAIGGAKLGAAIGTLAGPIGTVVGGGIGALVGGIGGEFLGRKAGKALTPTTAYADETSKDRKSKDLVSRKELIIKREERLLDKLEAGNLFNINVESPKNERKTKSTGTNKKTGSSYADARNQYAFNKANGIPVDTGPLEVGENFDKIWRYFKKQGFSDAGTAGIMANLKAESGLNPAQKQYGGGPGRGLAQWEGPRFDNLVNFAKSRGTDWTDLKTQLDFLMKEMNSDFSSSFYDSFKTSNNAWQSAADFENKFERPAQNHNAERGQIANQILSKGKSIGSVSASPNAKPNISSYAIGIDRVPEDQLAFIHKDEAVLSKFDAKEYRENNYSNESNGTLNLNVSINGADGDMESRLMDIIMSAIKQISNNQQKFQLNQVYQRKAR